MSKPLKLTSHQIGTYIEFLPRPEISSRSFQVTASLEGRRVTCADIAMLQVDAFLQSLKRVVTSGERHAILEGTYDFRLTIRPDKDKRSIVSFYIADYIAAAEKPGEQFMRLALQGSFPLPSDVTARLLDDFDVMFYS